MGDGGRDFAIVAMEQLHTMEAWRAPWEADARNAWAPWAYRLYRVAPWPAGHDGADDFSLCARLSPDLANLRMVEPCMDRIARDFAGRLFLWESVACALLLLWAACEVRAAVRAGCRWACCRIDLRRD